MISGAGKPVVALGAVHVIPNCPPPKVMYRTATGQRGAMTGDHVRYHPPLAVGRIWLGRIESFVRHTFSLHSRATLRVSHSLIAIIGLHGTSYKQLFTSYFEHFSSHPPALFLLWSPLDEVEQET